MKIRELIEIADASVGLVPTTPFKKVSHIYIDENLTYFSQSKGEEVSILDMDINHVARALNKSKHYDVDNIKRMLSRVRVLINSIEEELDNGTR